MSASEWMTAASLEALLMRALDEALYEPVARAAGSVGGGLAEVAVTANVCVLFEKCFRAMGGEGVVHSGGRGRGSCLG